MGRESGTQATRIILVGPPGIGKAHLAKDLADKFSAHVEDGLQLPGTPALGINADYRIELKLAVDRSFIATEAFEEYNEKMVIFTHSLIDSLTYSTFRFQFLVEYPAVSQYTMEKWAVVTGMVGALLKDSLKYDHIFLLKRTAFDPDDESFQERLQLILDDYELPYTVLEGGDNLQNLQEAATIIEGYVSESAVPASHS